MLYFNLHMFSVFIVVVEKCKIDKLLLPKVVRTLDGEITVK